jgi:hypothetical protein
MTHKNLLVVHQPKKLSVFYGIRQPAFVPCPEPEESSPNSHSIFQIYFNIIMSPITMSFVLTTVFLCEFLAYLLRDICSSHIMLLCLINQMISESLRYPTVFLFDSPSYISAACRLVFIGSISSKGRKFCLFHDVQCGARTYNILYSTSTLSLLPAIFSNFSQFIEANSNIFSMALPAHSGPRLLIQFRNHFSQRVRLL